MEVFDKFVCVWEILEAQTNELSTYHSSKVRKVVFLLFLISKRKDL